MTAEETGGTARLRDEIRALATERRAIILAHNYQRPEVQSLADYVGDSLGLARRAQVADADVIVLCGVHFMAETAAILCPEQTVLLPEREAGCSLAASINADDLRTWKSEHPGAVVVSYVNTSAEVKAESDYCCTSGNARAVIDSIPADREVLFTPDLFMGTWLRQVTGRPLFVWSGECHVHAGIRPDDLKRARERAGGAELLVHPECGCTSQALAFADDQTHILSTEGMIRHAKRSSAERFVVATETGVLHRLRLEAPSKHFEPLREDAVCQYMKMTTVESVRDALLLERYRITVPADTALRARTAIERMVAIS